MVHVQCITTYYSCSLVVLVSVFCGNILLYELVYNIRYDMIWMLIELSYLSSRYDHVSSIGHAIILR
jgi:hypothetical protein